MSNLFSHLRTWRRTLCQTLAGFIIIPFSWIKTPGRGRKRQSERRKGEVERAREPAESRSEYWKETCFLISPVSDKETINTRRQWKGLRPAHAWLLFSLIKSFGMISQEQSKRGSRNSLIALGCLDSKEEILICAFLWRIIFSEFINPLFLTNHNICCNSQSYRLLKMILMQTMCSFNQYF